MQKKFGIAVVAALLAPSLAAEAQDIPAGAERGAVLVEPRTREVMQVVD